MLINLVKGIFNIYLNFYIRLLGIFNNDFGVIEYSLILRKILYL